MRLSVLFVSGAILTQPMHVLGQTGGTSSVGVQGSIAIRSHPSGMEIYIVPKSALGQPFGLDTLTLTKKEYLVGTTPFEIHLNPGEYAVTIKCKPMHFWGDGESEYIFELHEGGPYLVAKVYRVTVQAGHKSLVAALFWPTGQPLKAFADTLPRAGYSFTPPEGTSLKDILQEHDVPEVAWEPLSLMFRRIGKAVWHTSYGSARTCLYVYLQELEPEKLLGVRALSEAEVPESCLAKIIR